MYESQKSKHLLELVAATLISEGEFLNSELFVPFDRKKAVYLATILKTEQLQEYIEVDVKKGQLKIRDHPILPVLQKQWYKNNTKVLNYGFDPLHLSLKSIILAINLFGIRKQSHISVPTNIDRHHIKLLAYCINYHLRVTVVPGVNEIKITNILKVIDTSLEDIAAIHSGELIKILTKKEKQLLMKGGARYE